GQRFGFRQIIDVLRGANTQKIRHYQHDQLPIYGIGKDQSADEWQRIGRALIHQGLLTETTDGYPVLRLNELSMEILRKERTVEIQCPPKRCKNARSRAMIRLPSSLKRRNYSSAYERYASRSQMSLACRLMLSSRI